MKYIYSMRLLLRILRVLTTNEYPPVENAHQETPIIIDESCVLTTEEKSDFSMKQSKNSINLNSSHTKKSNQQCKRKYRLR